ncbi:SusE domain-containing protein [Prevotella sp. P6B1]|uniref:SusE domain-containing protein n=1 Tax=Prevotella sp. P6B1 TaxID=1410613 RepID=UPI00051AE161|nr:SusE domain-containing protein [Prevotella sp. P6B1]
MKTKNIIKTLTVTAMVSMTMLSTSCSDTIDNLYSKNKSEIQLNISSDYIKLDESNPDATALTIDWDAAHNFGEDYITTYKYEFQLIGSKADELKEYEDDGKFQRTYTNKELQDILVNHFGLTTSTVGNVLVTVTATFEGPKLIVPDISTVYLKIKTYGPKQFKADKLYIAGSAVGEDKLELTANETSPELYVWNGALNPGKVFFPVTNADEQNAIGPATADEPVTTSDMEAIISDEATTNSWVVSKAGNYRVTVNMNTHKVKIVEEGAVVEVDQMYMAGSAVGAGQIELAQTLENENVYAWRGELAAGNLYIPLSFDGAQEVSIVPQDANSHDIQDGEPTAFGQAATSTALSKRYWTIPAAGTYRIVVNTNEKTIAIYSAATDMQPKQVSWNNTTLKINPYVQKVNVLYMYGTFNSFAHDEGVFTGFQSKYNLIQSAANPYVFVYKGDPLPRETAKDERSNDVKAAVKFCTDNQNNNIYAYGSTASAKRNDHNGYVEAQLGKSETLVAGQGDNRYAYFVIPEGCNYVEVNIDKLTVVFDQK